MILSKQIAVRKLGLLIGALLGLSLGIVLAGFLLLRGSLAELDGERRLEGTPVPFLPGAIVHRLILVPKP